MGTSIQRPHSSFAMPQKINDADFFSHADKIRAEIGDFQHGDRPSGDACIAKSCKSFIIAVTPAVNFFTILSRFMFQTGANHGVARSVRKCVFEVKNDAPGANRTRDLLLRRESRLS